MAQVLIRDVPDHVVAAIDRRAARLGLSRSEFLRRRLAQEATTGAGPVTVDDLRGFASTFADLADDELMRDAWK